MELPPPVVRFGIWGTGAVAHRHAEAIAACDRAELVSVYNRDPAKARAFAEKHGARAFESQEEFLASGIDAVSVATPSGAHLEAVGPSARAGKHVLCEKPLETTVGKVNDLVRLCESRNIRLSAVYQSRFGRSVARIREAVDLGRFGRPVLASASLRWYRTPEYFSGSSWRGTWALDGGGALMNQGVHTVDLLLYFNGDVEEVTGRIERLLHRGIEVEDTAVAICKFKNRSLGMIEASTACAPGFPRRIELSGTDGSVVLEDDRITRWTFAKELPEDERIRSEGRLGEGLATGAGDPGAIGEEGHRRQIQELVAAILDGKPITTPGAEGKRAVDFICAVYESARTGTSIKFL